MYKVCFAVMLLAGIVFCFAGCGPKKSVKSDLKVQEKLVVQDIVEDSPAQEAGIRKGDVILKYNGKPVTTSAEVNELKEKVKSDSVEILVGRNGEQLTFKLPVGTMGVYLIELLPEIERKEDAVILDGIAKLEWSTGKTNSFLAAVEAVGKYLGVDRDYVYLNGVSGAAFRLHFHEDWCPSSPDPTCGYNSGEEALKAMGFEYNFEFIEKDDSIGQENIRKKIMESIDRGMPVIAIDLIAIPEWGIITGYQSNGEELFCRTYYDKRAGYDIAEKFPWAVYFIEEKKEMPDDIDNYTRSFAIVLENLTTPAYDKYTSGISAFDMWLKRLKTDDFNVMEIGDFKNISHANAWIYDRLICDRELAIEYLGRIAGNIPELTQELQSLEKLYKEELELLKPSEGFVMYGGMIKSKADWSPEMREEAIARLSKAKEKEEEALKIWKQINKLTSEVE
jgi:hypothetical protein